MKVYIGNTGHIKNHQNFILVPGIQKTDFPDFSGIFKKKMPETGISSETTRNASLLECLNDGMPE